MELHPGPACAVVYLCPRMRLSAPGVAHTTRFPWASSSVCLNQARRVAEQARLALSGIVSHRRLRGFRRAGTEPGPAIRILQPRPGEEADSRARGNRIARSVNKISRSGPLSHYNRISSARPMAQTFPRHHPPLSRISPKIPINLPIVVIMPLAVQIFNKVLSVPRSVPFCRQHSKIRMATAEHHLWHPRGHPG